MKLLTLLTTLFITLASSNVFAQKFVCENWVHGYSKKEIQGTAFVGEWDIGDSYTLDDDTYIIRDNKKIKKTLTYIGGDNAAFAYYTSGSGYDLRVFSIISSELAIKWSKDGKTQLAKYDLGIAELWGYGVQYQTFCKWEF